MILRPVSGKKGVRYIQISQTCNCTRGGGCVVVIVNGFYGISLVSQHKIENAQNVLAEIKKLNAKENYGFYENFNTKTQKAIGIPSCTWSAAGEIIVTQYINGKRFLV